MQKNSEVVVSFVDRNGGEMVVVYAEDIFVGVGEGVAVMHVLSSGDGGGVGGEVEAEGGEISINDGGEAVDPGGRVGDGVVEAP